MEALQELNVEELVTRAKAAQEIFEDFSQREVDEIVRDLGKIIYDHAEELAKMAVAETGMGNVPDKTAKNMGKSKMIWKNLKGKKSIGIINEDTASGITEIAKPKGIIAAVVPCTNPVVTPMCNSMFALKGQNAVIISPHPKAKNVNIYVTQLLRSVLASHEAPVDLIQTIVEPSIRATNDLMNAVDVVIATGGSAMVKSAYSCGKPAFGVGPGNVQVLVDRGVDFEAAIEKIIIGRTFDNGIICSGEQSVFLPEESYKDCIEIFRKKHVYYTEDPEITERLSQAIFPGDGPISRKVVGKSVQEVAAAAGILVPADTRMILIKSRAVGAEEPLCREKMCPVMIATPYIDFKNAVSMAGINLDLEGKGHTCAVHSNCLEHINYAGLHLPVSRLIVNQSSSTGAGGSLYNGFNPTTTLGCGSWGNNSISENLNYTHLINISRIGHLRELPVVPTDADIWSYASL